MPITNFFNFLIQIYTSSNDVPRRNLLLPTKRLDWSRDVVSGTLIPLKPSYLVVSFSIVENEPWKMPERCVAARCSNVADPTKNILMHKIPFFGKECPIKKKRRKR